MIKATLAGCVLLLVGAAGGVEFGRTSPAAHDASAGGGRVAAADGIAPSASSGVFGVSAAAASMPPSAVGSAEIRAIVREELTSALGRIQGRASAEPAVASVVPSPEEQHQAMDNINAILAGGQWSKLTRLEFHQQLARLTTDQREQAMQQLVRAIDGGSLRLVDGPQL